MHLGLNNRSPARKANRARDWHGADVIAALHKSGQSLRQLSLSHGYSADTLGAALVRSYPKAERIIAEALNLPISAIWPERVRIREARRARKLLKEPARDQVGSAP